MINNPALYKVSLLILFALFVSCSANLSRNEREALSTIKKIRNAQRAFKAENAKYGSLKDLASTNLIESELEDEIDGGYRFITVADDSTYSVSAVPLYESGQIMGEIRIYLDETGIIRASFKASVPADKSSESIVNQ